MKSCVACGMPLNDQKEIGCEIDDGSVCVYCSVDGKVKSCDEVFEGGVNFFMSAVGEDKELAERLVRKNMNSLPYWQKNKGACLDGEQAADQEFSDMMAKL